MPRRIRLARGVLLALAALTLVDCTAADVPPPDAQPAPITQPTEGDGWRLLAEQAGVGEAFRTGIATTGDQLWHLLDRAGFEIEPPEVDWDKEVAVWFGAAYGTSCPVRLVDVLVTDDVLHGVFPLASGATEATCPADANPHAFVVALERALLPAGPFTIQLRESDPPVGARAERTVVDVDLSVPGSTFGNPRPPIPAEASPAVPHRQESVRPELILPLDVFWLGVGTGPSQWLEIEQRTQDCLAERGLEYVPEWSLAEVRGFDMFGVVPERDPEVERAWAMEHGYGLATISWEDFDRADFVSLMPEVRPGPNAHLEGGPSLTACRTEAQTAVLGDAPVPGHGSFDDLQRALSDVYVEIREDRRLRVVRNEWAACLADAGYPGVRSLLGIGHVFGAQNLAMERVTEIQHDVWGDGSVPGPAGDDPVAQLEYRTRVSELAEWELALAAADWACRDRVGTWDTFFEVIHEYQLAFIAEHEDRLEDYARWFGVADWRP